LSWVTAPTIPVRLVDGRGDVVRLTDEFAAYGASYLQRLKFAGKKVLSW
jgi:hypothetical protein